MKHSLPLAIEGLVDFIAYHPSSPLGPIKGTG
jgi:hypothetical protein